MTNDKTGLTGADGKGPPSTITSNTVSRIFQKSERMHTKPPPSSLSGKLQKTTRVPFYVQPSLWTHRQLEILLVTVHDGPAPLRAPFKAGKRLTTGAIDPIRMDEARTRHEKYKQYQYIENLVWNTVQSFQTLATKERFIIHSIDPIRSAEMDRYANTLTMKHFDDHKCVRIKCGFFVRTANRGDASTKALPILAYNDPVRRWEARLRSLGDFAQKKMRFFGCFRKDQEYLGIEPYDVAILLAMAQEQHHRLSRSTESLQTYTTYLITPDENQKLFLYTAEISSLYLFCLTNPREPMKDRFKITRTPLPIDDDGSVLLQTLERVLEAGMQLVDRTRSRLTAQTLSAEPANSQNSAVAYNWGMDPTNPPNENIRPEAGWGWDSLPTPPGLTRPQPPTASPSSNRSTDWSSGFPRPADPALRRSSKSALDSDTGRTEASRITQQFSRWNLHDIPE